MSECIGIVSMFISLQDHHEQGVVVNSADEFAKNHILKCKPLKFWADFKVEDCQEPGLATNAIDSIGYTFDKESCFPT